MAVGAAVWMVKLTGPVALVGGGIVTQVAAVGRTGQANVMLPVKPLDTATFTVTLALAP